MQCEARGQPRASPGCCWPSHLWRPAPFGCLLGLIAPHAAHHDAAGVADVPRSSHTRQEGAYPLQLPGSMLPCPTKPQNRDDGCALEPAVYLSQCSGHLDFCAAVCARARGNESSGVASVETYWMRTGRDGGWAQKLVAPPSPTSSTTQLKQKQQRSTIANGFVSSKNVDFGFAFPQDAEGKQAPFQSTRWKSFQPQSGGQMWVLA